MSFYGWPIAQCQLPTNLLTKQLHGGIRVVDIRLAAIDSTLIAYHGIYPEQTHFKDILSTLHSFLAHPHTNRETVVVSIKQENFRSVAPLVFSRMVREQMEAAEGGLAWWFLENRVPRLGEVRGKAVMFSRFGADGTGWEGGLEGLGIHPTYWPDSEKRGFTWMCKNTVVAIHDWYDVPSFLAIPEKTSLSTAILLPLPRQDELPVPPLKISYFSAAAFPLSLPTMIARGVGWPSWGLGVEGVNVRVGRWLLSLLAGDGKMSAPSKLKAQRRGTADVAIKRLRRLGRVQRVHRSDDGLESLKEPVDGDDDHEDRPANTEDPRIRGWVLMDYYSDPRDGGVVPLLVECNFRARVSGEEGWP